MVVREDLDEEKVTKELKDLLFEPVLTLKKEVNLSGVSRDTGYYFAKCSVESELGLLGVNCDGSGKRFFCVDMATNDVIFQQPSLGYHGHHWIVHKEQKYLSLQTKKNMVQMFQFDAEKKTFKEDKRLKICVSDEDEIRYSVFDSTCNYIFIFKNRQVLEKLELGQVNSVTQIVELEEKVGHENLRYDDSKQLAISNDDAVCAIGGGTRNDSFYLIDLSTQVQHKLTSEVMGDTYSPCFINGVAEYVAVGGEESKGVEIWDIKSRQPFKKLETGDAFNQCIASTNNILAVAPTDGSLKLWDVRNWEVFHSAQFKGLSTTSLHLTAVSKYLTIAGDNGDFCIVMEIK